MYLKIDSDIYEKIKEITITDYEKEGDFLPYDSIVPIFEDLLAEISHLQEKIEDMENDIESNYKPVSVEEQIGWSHNW